MSNSTAERLRPVLARIESHLKSPFDMSRQKKIAGLVDSFSEQNYWDRTSIYLKINESYHSFQTHPEIKENFRDRLIAFLFFKNRQRFEGGNYDFAKEKRQIEATVQLLEGNHVHMGTGEGKTTVVFPIVNIVEALTSEKKQSVMVTTDEALLLELKSNIDFFSQALKASLVDFAGINTSAMAVETGRAGLSQQLNRQMLQESLLTGSYADKTKEAIRKTYWSDLVAADRAEEHTPSQFEITLATDRALIFKFQDKSKKFIFETPNIYFDEADVPYNRRSPYVGVNENQYYSPEEMLDSTVDWMRRFIIARQLNPSDYQPDQGSYTLSENKSAWLKQLNFAQSLTNYDFHKPNLADPIIQAFQDGLDLILAKLGLNPEQKKQLADRLIKGGLDLKLEAEDTYYPEIGEQLARLYKSKGLIYKLEGETPQVRDAYIDQILKDHKFSWQDRINILALEGIFEFVPLNPVSYKSTTFQTFTNRVKSRLRCASGTLMFPDPESQRITLSPFASFLRDATGAKIEVVTQPEIKNVPDPVITDLEIKAINKLENSLPADKPTLIVSYQLDNSEEIFKRLKVKLGEESVAYIPSKPTSGEELLAYDMQVKKIYSDLAEGRLKAVVSSGAAGFGVNIVKKDGSYPNLHVVLHGLPANRSQLMQILGRRRASGDDFSWYVSQEFLQPYINLFEDRVSSLAIRLGKLDRDEVKRRLDIGKKDPAKAKKLMLEILRKSEQSDRVNDEFFLLFDELLARYYLKFVRIFRKKIRLDKPEAFRFLNLRFGLPENLKDFINRSLLLVPRSTSAGDMRSFFLQLDRYLNQVDKTTNSSLLSAYVTDWYRQRKPIVEAYHQTAVKEGGKLYFHQPVTVENYLSFKSLQPDPLLPDVNWGCARIPGKGGKRFDILAFQKAGQTYFVYDASIRYLTFLSQVDLEKTIEDIISNRAFHLYNLHYSFLAD